MSFFQSMIIFFQTAIGLFQTVMKMKLLPLQQKNYFKVWQL